MCSGIHFDVEKSKFLCGNCATDKIFEHSNIATNLGNILWLFTHSLIILTTCVEAWNVINYSWESFILSKNCEKSIRIVLLLCDSNFNFNFFHDRHKKIGLTATNVNSHKYLFLKIVFESALLIDEVLQLETLELDFNVAFALLFRSSALLYH